MATINKEGLIWLDKAIFQEISLNKKCICSCDLNYGCLDGNYGLATICEKQQLAQEAGLYLQNHMPREGMHNKHSHYQHSQDPFLSIIMSKASAVLILDKCM